MITNPATKVVVSLKFDQVEVYLLQNYSKYEILLHINQDLKY